MLLPDRSYHLYPLTQLQVFKDKCLVITGTTSGVGFVTAKTALDAGMNVIVLNRQSVRVDEMLSRLNHHPRCTAVDCDLASFESVRKAAAKVIALSNGCVDMLSNNAGIMALPRSATVDGYEVQLQVNHLSHFLLTKLLMNSLINAADKNGSARIINHSSSIGDMVGDLDENYYTRDSLKWGDDGRGMFWPQGGRWRRYAQTKFANQVFTHALHNKLQQANIPIKVLAVHPGLAQTQLQPKAILHQSMSPRFTRWMFRWLGQSEADGALPMIHAIASQTVESGCRVEPKRYLYGLPVVRKLRKRPLLSSTLDQLWQLSCEAVHESFDPVF